MRSGEIEKQSEEREDPNGESGVCAHAITG